MMIDGFQLRPYQIKALNVIYNDLQVMPEVLLSAIMGSGKTAMAVKLIERLARENPSMSFLILIHKRELIIQFHKSFQNFTDIHPRDIGISCAGLGQKTYNRKITIASIQTFNNQTEQYSGAGLIVIDECHSVNLDSDTMYKQIIDYLRMQRPNCRILGITATEYRLGLGEIFGTRNKPGSNILFPKLNHKIKYSTLRDAGHLVPLRGVVASPAFMEEDLAGISINAGEYNITELGELLTTERHLTTAVQAINEHCGGMDCICVVCCDIKHAEALLELLEDDATIVHSQLSDLERLMNMMAWESGEKRIMVSVRILLEGYDLPRMKAIVNLRPTLSTRIYLQTIGRVLRPHETKEYGFLVDVTDNANRLLKNFDLDNPIVTVPKAVEEADKKIRKIWKICPECEVEVHVALRECLDCGFAWPETECIVAVALPNMKEVIFEKEPPEIFDVHDWSVSVHTSRKNNKLLGKIEYKFHQTDLKLSRAYMFLCLPDFYDGYAVEMSKKKWKQISNDTFPETVEDLIQDRQLFTPLQVEVDLNGKYPDLKRVICDEKIVYIEKGEVFYDIVPF